MIARISIVAVALLLAAEPAQVELRAIFRDLLWGQDTVRAAAQESWAQYRRDRERFADISDPREEFLELEEVLREGRPVVDGATGEVAEQFDVTFADGRSIPVFVATPPGYTPDRPWPVIFAMHGGPPGNAEGATRGAVQMVSVWREAAAEAGWIIVSPAMTHVRSMGTRTSDRLPYEILRPEQVVAILATVQRRYRVDRDRIVSTGISLGSNFSIGYAAAVPDLFAAIVPVSTEGDSREHLLRNLQHVPTYVLEGAQDRNIRGINGPRAMRDILARFAYDATYREFNDRAHEGFSELYPDVLRWLAARPRRSFPRAVLRVPHDGIMPLSRRVFWVASDTRQGIVEARVAGENHIEVRSRWARSVTLYLSDRLVDLDRPVRLTVNGIDVGEYQPRRSISAAVGEVRTLDDGGRPFADVTTVDVPLGPASIDVGMALAAELEPKQPEGQLSFWEFYAVNALAERFPSLGIEGREIVLGEVDELAAASIFAGGNEIAGIELSSIDSTGPFGGAGLRVGDILLEVGGEPFFRGAGGLPKLHHWLVRELTATPRRYRLLVIRAGVVEVLEADLALGPYTQ